MAYMRNNLVSRSGYSGFGDIWDSITGAASSVLKFYGTEQQAVGAAAATQQQNRDLTAALMSRQGIGSDVMVLGGAALVAYLLLRKKKAE